MKTVTKDQLPIRSRSMEMTISSDRLNDFKESLGSQSPFVSPTLGVITMDSMFEITRSLEIPDEHLLHLQQTFFYRKPLQTPGKIKFSTALTQWRVRGNAAWATFETKVFNEGDDEVAVETEFKILVQGGEK